MAGASARSVALLWRCPRRPYYRFRTPRSLLQLLMLPPFLMDLHLLSYFITLSPLSVSSVADWRTNAGSELHSIYENDRTSLISEICSAFMRHLMATYLVQFVNVEGEHLGETFAHFQHVKVVTGLCLLELRAWSYFQSCPSVDGFFSKWLRLLIHLLILGQWWWLMANCRCLDLGCFVWTWSTHCGHWSII